VVDDTKISLLGSDYGANTGGGAGSA
jgi:hypothetical protein